MQHSTMEFEKAVLSIYMPNAVDTVEAVPIFVPLNLPPEWQEIIEEAVRTSPDMRIPNPDDPCEGVDEAPCVATAQQQSLAGVQEKAAQALAKQHAGKSPEEIRREFPGKLGERVIVIAQSLAPTVREAFAKRQKKIREADREFGKGLVAAGVVVQHHSVPDYTRVILAQLDSFLEGLILSDSALLRIAFPDDPAKAKSIGNSRNGKRYKQAWGSPAVMNHPMEKAMQRTHNRHGMNRRLSARTFGQSLGMNVVLFKSSDRITKLEARVQLLEQQMQATKQREALADTGAVTPKEMVLRLYAEEVGPTMIAKQLGMQLERVRSIIARSKRP